MSKIYKFLLLLFVILAITTILELFFYFFLVTNKPKTQNFETQDTNRSQLKNELTQLASLPKSEDEVAALKNIITYLKDTPLGFSRFLLSQSEISNHPTLNSFELVSVYEGKIVDISKENKKSTQRGDLQFSFTIKNNEEDPKPSTIFITEKDLPILEITQLEDGREASRSLNSLKINDRVRVKFRYNLKEPQILEFKINKL